jgi:hypothetical protein
VRAKLEIIAGGDRKFESELLEKLYHEEKMNKCVLYMTSFEAVRKTYDDCNALLKLMALLQLKVQVKDVYLEPRFLKELDERTPGANVRCAFSGRNLHSRMPLDPTPVRFKRTGV